MLGSANAYALIVLGAALKVGVAGAEPFGVGRGAGRLMGGSLPEVVKSGRLELESAGLGLFFTTFGRFWREAGFRQILAGSGVSAGFGGKWGSGRFRQESPRVPAHRDARPDLCRSRCHGPTTCCGLRVSRHKICRSRVNLGGQPKAPHTRPIGTSKHTTPFAIGAHHARTPPRRAHPCGPDFDDQ